MSMFDFKHHKTTITGLLMRAQLTENTDRKTGEIAYKVQLQLICNDYDLEKDLFRKPTTEQYSSKSAHLLKDFEALEGKVISFPVSSMIAADKSTVYWIPAGVLPVIAPQLDIIKPAPAIQPTNSMGTKPPETK